MEQVTSPQAEANAKQYWIIVKLLLKAFTKFQELGKLTSVIMSARWKSQEKAKKSKRKSKDPWILNVATLSADTPAAGVFISGP